MSENKSIYNIKNEYVDLISTIEELEGELTPELEEALKLNEEQLVTKATCYCDLISKLESEVTYIDSQIERVNKFKAPKEKAIETLKKNLLSAVLLFGEEGKETTTKTGKVFRARTLELPLNKLTAKRSPKIEIVDPLKIPLEFTENSITIKKLDSDKVDRLYIVLTALGESPEKNLTISKTKIKEAIESGNEVSGAYYNEENYSLIIK